MAWLKRSEEGYCLLHSRKLSQRKVHEKCTNPHRAGCTDGKKCRHLLVIRKGMNTK